jgi:Family of unknown function (DUF6498)
MPTTAAAPAKIGWLATLNPRFLTAPSTLVLIAANLLPLYGVIFWGWDLYGLMVLYWMETGIIGFFALVRMAMAAGLAAIVLVPFFVVHFGGFMAGHIFFITVLFRGIGDNDGIESIPNAVLSLIFAQGLWAAFLALFISHSVSFVLNVWRPARDARRAQPGGAAKPDKKDAGSYMMAPYGRIVVMHLTIIFGAFLIQAFQTKTAAFLLLVILKVTFDIIAHVRKNYAAVGLAMR